MTLLIGYVFPALFISSAALIALRIAHRAPPAIRFALALTGLAAWLIPWSYLTLPSLSPAASLFGNWIGESSAALSDLKQNIGLALETVTPAATLPVRWWLLLFVPGLIWLCVDLAVFFATVSRWRHNSRSGSELRRYFPRGVGGRNPRIRIVTESNIAVASGWLSPTIWIGDRVVDEQELRTALTHEAIHLRRLDPVWLMLVAFVARLFWFNPIIYSLKREAILAIESCCDEECAALLGRRHYRNTLAQLVLKRQQRAGLEFAAALRVPSVDLLRLASLESPPRMNGLSWTSVAAVIAVCALSAGFGSAGTSQSGLFENPAVTDSSRYGYDLPPVWSSGAGRSR